MFAATPVAGSVWAYLIICKHSKVWYVDRLNILFIAELIKISLFPKNIHKQISILEWFLKDIENIDAE